MAWVLEQRRSDIRRDVASGPARIEQYDQTIARALVEGDEDTVRRTRKLPAQLEDTLDTSDAVLDEIARDLQWFERTAHRKALRALEPQRQPALDRYTASIEAIATTLTELSERVADARVFECELSETAARIRAERRLAGEPSTKADRPEFPLTDIETKLGEIRKTARSELSSEMLQVLISNESVLRSEHLAEIESENAAKRHQRLVEVAQRPKFNLGRPTVRM